MNKPKLLLTVPLLLIAGFIIHCWLVILFSDILATWRHYTGLLLFAGLVAAALRSFNYLVVGTGVYLLLATFNLLAITPTISTTWFSFGADKAVSTPPVQLLSLGLFVLYFVLNFDTMIEIHLDYKEAKQGKL